MLLRPRAHLRRGGRRRLQAPGLGEGRQPLLDLRAGEVLGQGRAEVAEGHSSASGRVSAKNTDTLGQRTCTRASRSATKPGATCGSVKSRE